MHIMLANELMYILAGAVVSVVKLYPDGSIRLSLFPTVLVVPFMYSRRRRRPYNINLLCTKYVLLQRRLESNTEEEALSEKLKDLFSHSPPAPSPLVTMMNQLFKLHFSEVVGPLERMTVIIFAQQ